MLGSSVLGITKDYTSIQLRDCPILCVVASSMKASKKSRPEEMKSQTNILLWEAKLSILKCLEKILNRYFTKGDHVEVSKDFIADTADS